MKFLKRIYKAIECLFYVFFAILFRIFLPIKNNRVLFWSYNYKKISCNPLYIANYLAKEHRGELDLYWALNKKNIEYSDDFHFVYWKSLKYLYILYTSKVVVTNMRILPMSLFLKRSKQVYIQTWHSSMRLKMIEQDALDSLPRIYKIMAKIDSNQCNYILSGSQFSSDTYRRAFWLPATTNILEFGTPRNDFLFNASFEEKFQIKKALDIADDVVVVMYAPTFRFDYSTDSYISDYGSLINGFSKVYGKKCVFLLRLHPNFLLIESSYAVSSDVIDVTTYDDMQELLSITDILLTDYSSAMFDFALTGKPCFIYAPDYKTYDRGTYFKLDELPFLHSTSELELLNQIAEFKVGDYNEKMHNFHKEKIGSFENGKATESVSKLIMNIIKNK